jgi:hypothetical protein
VKTLLATIDVAFVGCYGNPVYRAVTWIPICVSDTWSPVFPTCGRFPWEAPTILYVAVVTRMRVKIVTQKWQKALFENVSQFKHLGTTLTNRNLIEEEIKRRVNSGNT